MNMTTALKLYNTQPYLQAVQVNPIDSRALEMVKMLGWNDLPDRMVESIESDLIGFHDELTGRFATCSHGVRDRRKSVVFWVENYLNGICTYDTAFQMLKVKSL